MHDEPQVMLPCCQERRVVEDVEFLNIEEDMLGRDVMTYRCPDCGEVHKGFVFG